MTKAKRKRRFQRQQRQLLLILACAAGIALIIVLCFGRKESQQGTITTMQQQATVEGNWERVSAPTSGPSLLYLVNHEYSCDPAQASELVSLYDGMADCYSLRSAEIQVDAALMEPLNCWLSDFYAQTGLDTINIVAGYRTMDEQQTLYDNAFSSKGEAHAEQYIAHAGHSEHHTGLAVDLATWLNGVSYDFDGTGQYAWLVEHAWSYGFIQRYPSGKADITGISFESWHFRYVGLPHAKLIYDAQLCLEEYIAQLEQYPFAGQHLEAFCDGVAYEIYTCSKSNIFVPTDADYTISDTNTDTYVVTVQR